MSTLIHQRVEEARTGKNPRVISRLPSGWVVLGDVQFVRGYCLLLPDPVVPTLNDLRGADRARFLHDMTLLGDAVLRVTGAVRINYEMLGNVETALHAHVFPRYESEPPELRTRPVWFYDWKNAPAFDLSKHGALMDEIRHQLAVLRVSPVG